MKQYLRPVLKDLPVQYEHMVLWLGVSDRVGKSADIYRWAHTFSVFTTNIASNGWTVVESCTDNHGPERMNPNDFSLSATSRLTFLNHLVKYL